MRLPVSGVYSLIKAPGVLCAPVPLVVVARLYVAKSNEEWLREIVEDPWWFLDEFWWVLKSLPLFPKDLKDFAGFLGAAGPLGTNGILLSCTLCFAGV